MQRAIELHSQNPEVFDKEKLCDAFFLNNFGSDCRIPGPAINMCRCALKNEVYNNSCYSYSMRCK